MEHHINSYFKGEKQGSLVFLGLGLVASVVAAVGWWYFADAFWQGLAIPVGVIGLIQLFVGTTVFLRTDGQLTALLRQFQEVPQKFAAEEGRRMAAVNRNFQTYRAVELSLFILGFVLLFLGTLGAWGDWTAGMGVGLASQSALMLVLDSFAGWRGSLYEHQIKRL